MRIPKYATHRSLSWVSLSLKAGLASIARSHTDVFPYFHASWSSIRYPWSTIDFWKVLTFVFCSHRRRQCWYLVNWVWIPPLDVSLKAHVQMMEFGRLASLHKNVWMGCLNTPSEAQVSLKTFKERESERVRELTVPLFYYSRVFIMFKWGARFHNANLALVVMIAQRWQGNHHVCKTARDCVRRCIITQFVIL